MPKSADAFRTISEVAEWLETPAHVLRFWESKFSQVKPVKRAGGRRYYRPADMKLLGGIKKLLHEDGMTIKGVQKLLREQGIKQVAALSQPLDEVTDIVASEMAEDVPQEETNATVVSFQRADAAPDGTEEETTPEETHVSEADATPPPMMFKHSGSDADTLHADDEAEADPAPHDTADAEPPDAPQTAPAPPGESADKETVVPEPDTQPTFADTGMVPEATSADHASTDDDTQEQPAPLQVTVPDDPPDDIDAEPGVLTALASRDRAAPPVAQALSDIAQRLKSLHG